MDKLRRSTFLLAVIVVAGACIPTTGGGAGGPASLDNRTFLSTRVTDGDADRPLVPGTRIRLAFGDESQVGASAGCNSIGGSYVIRNGVLRFEGGGMTEMGCDPERHAQDDWLVTFLGSNPTVALAGNDLLLSAGGVTIALVDEEVANPDLPLAGTLWTVDTIVQGDMAMGLPGVAATIQFDGAGRAAIFTGCNEGGADVIADGATLQFANLVLTKRACDQAAGQVEAAVLRILRAPQVAYAIDAAALSLQAGPDGLILQGR